ncbi:MAG: amino acid permease [Deltaproteobacteria bacterium]|nr:amino acid permease [Deltaproteobacteria bacterium]
MGVAVTRRLGLATATLVVVANMVGTGVFCTSGLLLDSLATPGAVLLVWLVGGLVALCGALCYGELATISSRNGGEYRFLSDAFHPAVGFVAGWLSLVVGFAAPIAASGLAFGTYLHAAAPAVPSVAAGAALVLLASVAHAAGVVTGARLQNAVTVLNVAFIVAFTAAAAWVLPAGRLERLAPSGDAVTGSGFAVGLILVSYAYSGWNGAAYLAGEIREPVRTLPRALALGTGIVTLLYLALNAVFLLGPAPGELRGVVEVGHRAAADIFGPGAGRVVSALIACVLVSSVGSLAMVGPRVYEAMGEDYPALRFLRLRGEGGGPWASIALQGALALALLLTSSFGALLLYVGILLSAMAALTVAALFVLRRRGAGAAGGYRTWGYPLTPAVFLLFSAWAIAHSLVDRPVVAALAAATIASGLLLYRLVRTNNSSRTTHQ